MRRQRVRKTRSSRRVPARFAARYFGKGFRWQLRDLETSKVAYRMAEGQFEPSSREILAALCAKVRGNLQAFPWVGCFTLGSWDASCVVQA